MPSSVPFPLPTSRSAVATARESRGLDSSPDVLALSENGPRRSLGPTATLRACTSCDGPRGGAGATLEGRERECSIQKGLYKVLSGPFIA